MPVKDVSGRVRPGMFEELTLPDGRRAKPVSGRGGYITYDVDGTLVESRTGTASEVMMKLNPDPILMAFRKPRGRR